MKKIIGTTAFTIGIAALVILAALVWIVDRREVKSDTKELEKSVNGIQAIGVQYDGGQIFLTVHAEKNFTCAELFQVLDIGPIIVKDKVYLPACNIINGKLIEVVYKVKTA